jgi:hypothetical protein
MKSDSKSPSHQLERFIVRLPDGMRDAIAASAKANGRSMNAEIVYRLEESLKPQYRYPSGNTEKDLQDTIYDLLVRLIEVDPRFAASRAKFEDPKTAEKIYTERSNAAKSPKKRTRKG